MALPVLSDDVREFIEQGNLESAVTLLKSKLVELEDSQEACVLAQQLAEVYGYRADDMEWLSKSIHYAMLAGEGFVQEGQLVKALKVFYWLRTRPTAQESVARLRGLIAATFSSRRRSKITPDDDRPPPTPFQEIQASLAFDKDPPELKRFQLQTPESRQFAVFSLLKVQELEALLDAMDLTAFQPGQVVYQRDEVADAFFLVLEGSLEKKCEDRVEAVGPESFVGDLSFFSNRQRGVELKAIEKSYVIRFSQESFEEIIQRFPHVRERFFEFYERRMFVSVMSRHAMFRSLDNESLFDLFNDAVLITAPTNRVLFKKGSKADRFFLLMQGRCAQFQPGDFVGLNWFHQGATASENIITHTECSLLEWRRDVFADFLSANPAFKKPWGEKVDLESVALFD